jgi:hypothetical protein
LNPAAAGATPRNRASAVAAALFVGFICIGRYRTVRPQDITVGKATKTHA